MNRLAKLTQLFEEGVMVPVTAPGQADPMTFWVNKLSPFEQEQCNREGRIARARRMLAIKEIGTPDHSLFQASSASVSDAAIIVSMIEGKSSEHFLAAMRSVRSDPAWSDRIDVLSGDEPDSGDSAEVRLLSKIAVAHNEEVMKRQTALDNEFRRELEALAPEVLREQHDSQYVDNQGLAAFMAVQRKYQVFYFLRNCDAVTLKDGTWSHTKCKHQERTLADPSEVDLLPGAVLTPIQSAFQELMVDADTARFTAALPSSSDSSESSPSAEDSADSGPEETSPEPGTTSS